MQKIYSILILLVCLASPVARAQEPAKKPAYPLLLNLAILEIDLAPSEDLQSVARDQARVNGLIAGGKARVLATSQMQVQPGEISTFRVGDRVPIQVGSFPSFSRPSERRQPQGPNNVTPDQLGPESAPSIQYEEIGLTVEALATPFSGDMIDLSLKVEIKDIDRSTGNLTPSLSIKFLNSRSRLRLNERTVLLGVNGSRQGRGHEPGSSQTGDGVVPHLVLLLTARVIE